MRTVNRNILAHLPILRIEQERMFFADFALWRMPFATYLSLAGDVFSSLEKNYNATAPVFLHFDEDLETEDLPPEHTHANPSDEESKVQPMGVPESRSGTSAYDCLGLTGISSLAGPIHFVWSTLALAFPDMLLADPGLSQTFIVADEMIQQLAGGFGRQTTVQGPADYEYLCLGASSHAPLSSADVPRLREIFTHRSAIGNSAALSYSFRTFLEAHSPTLGPPERTTLAVIALEELLMPEVTRDLTRTFTRRLNRLCPELSPILGRNLYAARSDALHAGQSMDFDELAVHALRALSSAICEGARRIAAGKNIETVRAELDMSHAIAVGRRTLVPPSPQRCDRLLVQQRTTLFFGSGPSLVGRKNEMAFWSPLANLETREYTALSQTKLPLHIVPLNGAEIQSLEEKETRRDYANRLVEITEDRIAGLMMIVSDAKQAFVNVAWDDLQQMNTAFDLAAQVRDVATLSLRLAGFAGFWDPEWHGLTLFRDNIRTRRPTVFRQSVLMEIHRAVGMADRGQHAMATVGRDDWELLDALSGVLTHCIETGPGAIGRSLTLYRRASDPAFLAETTRARLAFAALESMLGRFADPDRTLSMEESVTRIMGDEAPEAVSWFRQFGRRARNRAAHLADPAPDVKRELAWLLEILRLLTLTYITAWGGHDPAQSADPKEVLLRQLTKLKPRQ